MYMMTPVVQTLIHPHTKPPLQRFSEHFHSWSQQRLLNFFPKLCLPWNGYNDCHCSYQQHLPPRSLRLGLTSSDHVYLDTVIDMSGRI